MLDLIINFVREYIIGFLVLISVLVFVHEYGHYIFAKMFKVKVESFSIGFGPEIFGWSDKSGTRWKICPIPFGGYVKMKGELIETEDSIDDKDEDSFQSKQLWQKFLIVLAGPLFNLILPIFILFFISFFFGTYVLAPKIDKVIEGGPAYNILKKGDVVLEINGDKIKVFSDLQQKISLLPDTKLNLKVMRDEKAIDLVLTTSSRTEGKYKLGYLGISADQSGLKEYEYSFKQSLIYSYETYIRVMNLMIEGLARLFLGKVSMDDIGGPIKIAEMSGESLQRGLDSWLFFLAMLSINLAIINLFPIPALDGGHLLLYTIQAVTRKKISFKVQNFLARIGFAFLMTLMALVILKDILSLF